MNVNHDSFGFHDGLRLRLHARVRGFQLAVKLDEHQLGGGAFTGVRAIRRRGLRHCDFFFQLDHERHGLCKLARGDDPVRGSLRDLRGVNQRALRLCNRVARGVNCGLFIFAG